MNMLMNACEMRWVFRDIHRLWILLVVGDDGENKSSTTEIVPLT